MRHVSFPGNDMKCIVLVWKEQGHLPYGKHEAHQPHFWWWTSVGGGHQLTEDFVPSEGPYSNLAYDKTEGVCSRYFCKGNGPVGVDTDSLV